MLHQLVGGEPDEDATSDRLARSIVSDRRTAISRQIPSPYVDTRAIGVDVICVHGERPAQGGIPAVSPQTVGVVLRREIGGGIKGCLRVKDQAVANLNIDVAVGRTDIAKIE